MLLIGGRTRTVRDSVKTCKNRIKYMTVGQSEKTLPEMSLDKSNTCVQNHDVIAKGKNKQKRL